MAPATSFLVVASLYGAAGVALGAFGAHGLRAHLDDIALATWQTAVSYHLVHALALLGTGLWLRLGSGTVEAPLIFAGWGFAAGVLLFSGSLYVLALGGPRLLGPVTPLGGVAFLLGWLALAWAAVRSGP